MKFLCNCCKEKRNRKGSKVCVTCKKLVCKKCKGFKISTLRDLSTWRLSKTIQKRRQREISCKNCNREYARMAIEGFMKHGIKTTYDCHLLMTGKDGILREQKKCKDGKDRWYKLTLEK